MTGWKQFPLLSLVLLMVFLLAGCNESYREVPISFEHEGSRLSGSIMLPRNSQAPYPVVVFVHGDGAAPYDAYGYYRPLWDRLARQGIASLSWNKPGIGDSQGDWESQSMHDRANETIAAIEMLKRRADIAPDNIGLLGYSQAGWVLPLVASQEDHADFMVLISTAINWMDQGDYLTKTRMVREGFSDEQIRQVIEAGRNASEQLFSETSTYEEYLQYYQANAELKEMGEAVLTPQRFQFVKLNWRSDARESLKNITSPTLAIFGGHDLNVDTAESIRVYKKIFKESANENLTIKIFPQAQHSLLKQKYFKETVPGIGFIVKFEILGEYAFADGFLDFVVGWIKKETEKAQDGSH